MFSAPSVVFFSPRSNCSGFLFSKLRLKVGVGVRLNKVSIERNNADNMALVSGAVYNETFVVL